MQKVTLVQWVRYKFDNLMSKGTIAPIILLMVVTVVGILVMAGVLFFSGFFPGSGNHILGMRDPKTMGFIDALWVTILRTLDGGTIASDPLHLGFLIFSLFATLVGFLIVSVLIGIVSSGVTRRISELRKGKSFVVETNHTVILGWSFQVFQIVSELCIANENQKNLSIAIIAEKDKIEMEDEIRAKVGDTKNTKVICRTGNPIDLQDLEIINLHQARSIIILAPETGDPDSQVIKTILAITNNPNRRPHPYKYHIVAEIRDPKNVTIAEIAGKDEVKLVIFDYLISRITAQTCRQPGLSVVFTELLDFSGDEIYFQEEPKLVGKTFVEVMFAYETSTIIGMRRKDGQIMIKPPMNTKFEAGDMVIAVSEDDDTVIVSGKSDYGIDPSAIRVAPKYVPPIPENTLILGWNRRAPLIVNELDNYVWPGSRITIVSENPNAENELALHCAELSHQTVAFWFGDTTNRSILDSLNIYQYNHIIVLSQTDLTDVQSTDARTLSTLLHLRDIADQKGHSFSIVSEMLDDRNRKLAEITYTDDFIVSVKLDSLMLSQISENKELKTVFEMLFSAGGPAIYIKPAENFIELNKPINFYTIMESARQRNQIAIGYKMQQVKFRSSEEQVLAYGVIVNPKKSNQIFFSEGDKVIVIADEEQAG